MIKSSRMNLDFININSFQKANHTCDLIRKTTILLHVLLLSVLNITKKYCSLILASSIILL